MENAVDDVREGAAATTFTAETISANYSVHLSTAWYIQLFKETSEHI